MVDRSRELNAELVGEEPGQPVTIAIMQQNLGVNVCGLRIRHDSSVRPISYGKVKIGVRSLVI